MQLEIDGNSSGLLYNQSIAPCHRFKTSKLTAKLESETGHTELTVRVDRQDINCPKFSFIEKMEPSTYHRFALQRIVSAPFSWLSSYLEIGQSFHR